MKKLLVTSFLLGTLGSSVQIAVADTSVNSSAQNSVVPLNQQSQKAWLGVALVPVPEALSKQLENVIPKNQGVMVQSVSPDSPAEKAGLQNYDILLSFKNTQNEQQLFSAQQLSGLVSSSNVNDEVILTLVRNGEKKDLKAVLGGKKTSQMHPMFGRGNHNFWRQQGFPDFWAKPFSQPNLNQTLLPQGRFPQMPAMPLIPKAQGQANVMQQFESISINSLADDRYKATVEYLENGGEKKTFTFEGKYDEIRKQIQENKELPDSKKNSLLNALKNNPDQLIPDGFMNFPQMPVFPSFDDFFKQRQVPSWFNNNSKL